jgi:ribosomal protein S18 acetylase RimI-like enzyme
MPTPPVGPRYRAATLRDADAVAALHADSWRRNYRGAYADAYLDGDVLSDRQEVWTQRLGDRSPNRRTIVAEGDGTIVGFVHVVLEADPVWGALIDNLHVTADRQRQGIGVGLMREAVRTVANSTPTTGLYLWVLEQNQVAQAFYESLGGRRVGRELVPPPGGNPSRLAAGAPARLRYTWAGLAGI